MMYLVVDLFLSSLELGKILGCIESVSYRMCDVLVITANILLLELQLCWSAGMVPGVQQVSESLFRFLLLSEQFQRTKLQVV